MEHFDPKLGGGQGGRDYTTEVDSWLYTFSVQHDPEGLIQLMGGRSAFNSRLDQLFVEQYGTSKFHFLGQFPDATGLVGLYSQGNEPSFHIPYLYDFSGQPWKAQKRVRQLLDVWYGDGPLGIPGDDDGGETSSWYVLSALGFYPECPGSPVYEIGSPIFASSSITMGNGKVFTVTADHVSAQNKYIQSATLNGKPWDKPWLVPSMFPVPRSRRDFLAASMASVALATFGRHAFANQNAVEPHGLSDATFEAASRRAAELVNRMTLEEVTQQMRTPHADTAQTGVGTI